MCRKTAEGGGFFYARKRSVMTRFQFTDPAFRDRVNTVQNRIPVRSRKISAGPENELPDPGDID